MSDKHAIQPWFLQVFWYPRKGEGLLDKRSIKEKAHPAGAQKWILGEVNS
jgi:hypothetical protein